MLILTSTPNIGIGNRKSQGYRHYPRTILTSSLKKYSIDSKKLHNKALIEFPETKRTFVQSVLGQMGSP